MSKVMVVANTSWNLVNFRWALIHRLRDEGYEVVVAAPCDDYSEKLVGAGFRYLKLSMNNKGTNPVEDVALCFRLFRLFCLEKPSVVLTYTPKPNIYASIAGGLCGRVVIPNISGLGAAFIRQGLITRIIKFLYGWALKYPSCVFFQNYDDLHLFVSLGLVKKEAAARIPGSGINTEVFSPLEKKTPNDALKFLLVGRILWDKGVGEYVAAARALKSKYPSVEFQLLGFLDVVNPQAVPSAQVEQWQSDGVISYLGASDCVVEVMRAADCVVLPSYREGLPRTLLEAASLAIPLIAADVPGCRDVIEDGVTGLLCQPRDEKSLAEKMERMIQVGFAGRMQMGQAGREKVLREFDEKIVLSQYLSVIEHHCMQQK